MLEVKARVLAAAVAILLPSCTPRRTVSQPIPITDEQRLIGINAIMNLRQTFNSANSCQSIYDSAAIAFHVGSKRDWFRKCTELKTLDGSWRSFTILFGRRFGDGLIDIYGKAETDAGTREMEITWLLQGNHTQLSRWLVLADNFEFPPARYIQQWDMPPTPHKDRNGYASRITLGCDVDGGVQWVGQFNFHNSLEVHRGPLAVATVMNENPPPSDQISALLPMFKPLGLELGKQWDRSKVDPDVLLVPVRSWNMNPSPFEENTNGISSVTA